MDHSEAIRSMAAEKYILGDLTAEERDSFEQHFFECSECALDVRAGVAFREHSRGILSESETEQMPSRVAQQQKRGWLAWMRPAVAIPVMTMLVAVVLVQNLVVYPRVRTELAQSRVPQILPSASLINVNTRGADRSVVNARSGQAFLLFIDIPGEPGASAYQAELYSPNGAREWTLSISPELTNDTVTVRVPAGLKTPGLYTLVVRSMNSANANTEVGRYPFELKLY